MLIPILSYARALVHELVHLRNGDSLLCVPSYLRVAYHQSLFCHYSTFMDRYYAFHSAHHDGVTE